MLHLHHLHGSSIPATDLRRQFLREDRHQFAIRRPNVRWRILRRKQHQLRKLACCQKREPAAVIDPPERQASIALDAVPAQFCRLKPFPTHRLNRIPEDRLHPPDFRDHAGQLFRTAQRLIRRIETRAPAAAPLHFIPKHLMAVQASVRDIAGDIAYLLLVPGL